MTNKIEISKRYIHNKKIYEVVNFVNLKNSSGVFVNGVVYKEVTDDEEVTDTYKLSVISEEEFCKNFSPYNLFVGDTVVAYSMGKLIRTYYVIEVKDGKAYFNTSIGEKSKLVTCDNVNFVGRVGVLNPDTEIDHINCLEYYLETPKLKQIIINKEYIDKIKGELMNISKYMGVVDVLSVKPEELSNYYQNLIEFSKETITQIKSWQQSKIQ